LIDAMTNTLPEGGDMQKRDKWIARRLDAVALAYRAHPLREAQRAELDDALDPLEKKTAGYPETLVALSRLRDLLESVREGGLPASPPPALQVYSTHIDSRPTSLTTLNSDAERLVAALTKEIHAREAALSDAVVRRAEGEAGKALTERGACKYDADEGRVRQMATSREREDTCRLVRLVAAADPKSQEQVLVALLVLRDRANMARWITAAEGSRPEHPFMSTVDMADARKLSRSAIAHPASVLGAMKAAELLVTPDFVRTKERAIAWEKLGDAPFDLIAENLK